MKHITLILIAALSLCAQTKIQIDAQTQGTLPVNRGGTGQTTQQAAIDALVPSQTSHSGKCLSTNGTTVSWQACGSGGGVSDPGANGVMVRTALNTTTARTITAGTGIAMANGDGVSGNPTVSIDTAVVPTKAEIQSGSLNVCAPTSGSGANYTCSMFPALTSYTSGMVVQFKPDVTCTGGATQLNINSIGNVNVKQSDGTTNPTASQCVAGRQEPIWYDGTVFRLPPASASSYDPLDPTVSYMTDEFAGSGAYAGSVMFWGQLKWRHAGNVSPGSAPAEDNHPYILQMSTTSTDDSDERLYLGVIGGNDGISHGTLTGNTGWEHKFIVRPNSTTARYLIGLAVWSVWQNEGVYLEYDSDTDTNWMFVTDNGPSATRTDSGVPFVAGNWITVRVFSDTLGGVKIAVNSTVSSQITATLPDDAITPMMYIQAREAAVKTLDVDWYAAKLTATR